MDELPGPRADHASLGEMKFEAIAVEQAAGLILGHNVTGEGGRRVLRKGRS